MIPIKEILSQHEWYDNHKLSLIMDCRRKAFWHLYWRGGLGDKVGPGANFGFAIHAALARYYKDWRPDASQERDRQAAAFRAFSSAYQKLFPDGTKVEKKHTHDRGLIILDRYFDHYALEDKMFKPVEPELGGLILVQYDPNVDPLPFEPFFFLFRYDGVFERVATGEWLIFETKTTAGGCDRELKRFELRRQTKGYTWSAQQFEPSHDITGVLANVILIAAEKMEFKRDYFLYTKTDLASWRAQTINIVRDWRTALGSAAFAPLGQQLDIMYQRTDACTNYGLCSFYDLCHRGPFYNLSEFEPNTWIPLE